MLLEHFLKHRFVLCLKFGPGPSLQVKNKRLSSSWPTGSWLTTGLLSSPCPQQLSVSHHFTPPGFSLLPAVVFFLPVPAPESFLGNVHIPARGLVTPSLELRPLSHCCAQEELLCTGHPPGQLWVSPSVSPAPSAVMALSLFSANSKCWLKDKRAHLRKSLSTGDNQKLKFQNKLSF